jgi:hypothetical protein
MKNQAAAKQPAKEEIIKPPSTALATTAPDYLSDYATEKPEGFEEVGAGDVKVPRLAVAQKGNPQVEEGNKDYISGLRPGQFFNTTTGENYGKTVHIVPLLKFENRIRFGDMDKGGGILCRSDDMIHGVGDNPVNGDCQRCPYAKFGSARDGKGKGKACNEFKNFPALTVIDAKLKSDEPLVWSAKSSHIEAAQEVIGLASRRRLADGKTRAAMWMCVFSLTTELKNWSQTITSYIIKADNAGWVAGIDTPMAKSAFDFMHELREQHRLITDEVKAEEFPEPGSAG